MPYLFRSSGVKMKHTGMIVSAYQRGSLIPTQREWLDAINRDGRVMAALSDLVRARLDLRLGPAPQGISQEAWGDIGACSSTIIFYDPGSLYADIIHYYNVEGVKPREYKKVQIPEINLWNKGMNDSLETLRDNEPVTKLLRALLDMPEERDPISLFERIYSTEARNIFIHTSDENDRRRFPEVCASMLSLYNWDISIYLDTGVNIRPGIFQQAYFKT